MSQNNIGDIYRKNQAGTSRCREPELPAAIASEKALIGSLLVDPTVFVRVATIVSGDDFLDPGMGAIFRTCAALRAEGKPIAPPLLVDRLNGAGVRNPAAEIFKLAADTPHAAHAVFFADEVREAAAKRHIAIFAEQLRKSAMNGTTAADLVGAMQAEVAALQARLAKGAA